MIECKKVSFSYPPNETDIGDRKGHGTLRNIDLSINDGDFVLLCGTSGCGKTTLTRLFNGLIPHYYDGKLEGTVMLDGEDMSGLSLFDISKKVGSVFQNPRSQFFNVDTTSEIAFGCENHGLEEAEIRKRVKLVSEQLNLTNLLDRSVFSLSGGEKQKIACGSAAAVEPDVFVLDEPSSNLDAYSIADFRKLLKILKSQGKTIIIAEHRLYYLYDLADRIIYLSDGEIQGDYTLPEFQLIPAAEKAKMGLRPLGLGEFADIEPASLYSGQGIWKLNHFHFAYKKQPETLSLENIELPAGNVTAVIGHNGAGKTTLSRCLCGLEKRCKCILEKDGTSYSSKQRLKLCYMVMQDVNHQLFTESVLEEVLLSMPGKDSDESPENVAKAEAILTEMDLLPYKACHPMGLSGGQKQRVAIASAIASERPVILFDEPTSGLDLFHMRQVADSVKGLADSGKTIVIVTHDPEFILRCCNYVIHLENGRLEENYFLQDTEGRERLFNFFMMEGGGGNQTV
ncbi:energy-coupling factor ABC transporter ATP-binding protein [[Clostridium] innocuum]|uniref:ABC transporter ATP-binding protein n=1 Tax=Clostridium innocuum TaxID=1522 RepID=UPI001C21DFBA|nr:energy-coupling factor ABC transporter ATP-binding protein [[Clostridium] innocuum]MBU9108801.1 energy-coupling factor ABC transporter ATP-binding protein [[Clostridium] innocuum]